MNQRDNTVIRTHSLSKSFGTVQPIVATALWCVVFVLLALAKFEKAEF